MQLPTATLRDVIVLAGLALFAFAALRDLATRRVDNGVPLAIAGLGIAAHLVAGDVLFALGAASLVFFAAACCWRRGWLGGADVKLFGAGALLAPAGGVCAFVLYTALAGGVLALIYGAGLHYARRPATTRPAGMAARLLRIERWRLARGGPLPYAVALAAGITTVLLEA